jgi:hypothetical protein
MPVDSGAIDDLANGTAIINAREQTSVPGHALVGIGGSTAFELAPEPLGAFYKAVNLFADTTSELFQGLQHDFVVGRESQEGGMPSNALTVFDGLDSIHVSVPNSPATGSLFTQFPAPSSLSVLLLLRERPLSQLRQLPQSRRKRKNQRVCLLPHPRRYGAFFW